MHQDSRHQYLLTACATPQTLHAYLYTRAMKAIARMRGLDSKFDVECNVHCFSALKASNGHRRTDNRMTNPGAPSCVPSYRGCHREQNHVPGLTRDTWCARRTNRFTSSLWVHSISSEITRGFKHLTEGFWDWPTGLKIGANPAGPRPESFPGPPGAGLVREAAQNRRFPFLPSLPPPLLEKHKINGGELEQSILQ